MKQHYKHIEVMDSSFVAFLFPSLWKIWHSIFQQSISDVSHDKSVNILYPLFSNSLNEFKETTFLKFRF